MSLIQVVVKTGSLSEANPQHTVARLDSLSKKRPRKFGPSTTNSDRAVTLCWLVPYVAKSHSLN